MFMCPALVAAVGSRTRNYDVPRRMRQSALPHRLPMAHVRLRLLMRSCGCRMFSISVHHKYNKTPTQKRTRMLNYEKLDQLQLTTARRICAKATEWLQTDLLPLCVITPNWVVLCLTVHANVASKRRTCKIGVCLGWTAYVADRLKTNPYPYVLPHQIWQFKGVRRNRRNPRIWARWGPSLAVGAWLTPGYTFLPTCVISAEFGRSRSNGTNVIKQIRLKMTPRVPPFKVTRVHRNRHGSIRHP